LDSSFFRIVLGSNVNSQFGSVASIDTADVGPSLPRRERLTLLIALAAVTALSWLYLIRMPMVPADLGAVGTRVLGMVPPRLADLWLSFMMWAVMMVAMMLPSASPMVLTYARIARSRSGMSSYCVWTFAAAYLVVWVAFSAAATAGQFILDHASMLHGSSRATPLVSVALLALAGLYQITPLKSACLGKCRSPLGFFMTEWRSGSKGAFMMGSKHGVYCVGCCWMLMALLFVFGVMNLLWVAALSGLVLLEKLAPFGGVIARASGLLMLAGAIALAAYR
jgi:predicted metal-binding membrane protein